jgi:hypothetical protein
MTPCVFGLLGWVRYRADQILLLRNLPFSGVKWGIRDRGGRGRAPQVNGHILNCLERAANAEERAQQSNDSANRSDNELLAQSWRHLARSYQFVEGLGQFLSEADRNKKSVLPPEMLIAVEQQPAAPEVKPIILRPRVKHETSFRDRLLKTAQDAREQAAGYLQGPGASACC